MSSVETFVVGGKAPEWLVSETFSGRVRVIRDEDNKFSYYSVNTVSGIKKAFVGDVIIKKRSGVAVLTGEQAQKYKIVPKKTTKQVIEKEDGNEE